jgi:hypothetical protein
MEPLLASLKRVRRRLLLVRALETGLAGTIGAAAFALLVTLLRIFFPQYVPVASAYPALPLGLALCGFACGFAVRLAIGVSVREAALAADHAAGLRERLATALEVLPSVASGPGDGRRGLLDDRLLEQARAVAAPLDPSRLALGRVLGRYGKAALAALFVLVAASFVPSVGGPALVPQTAQRAADTLERAAARPSVAPAVREKIEEAVRRLRDAAPRQGIADKATAAVLETAAQVETARRRVVEALLQGDNRELREMVRSALKGDAPGAATAARDLADRLGVPPNASGMPAAERERVADSLSGAAAAAAKDLGDLAKDLAAAAEAIRKGDPAAAETLARLADEMAKNLGEKPGGGVTAVVQAVGEARRTLSLAESSPAELARPGTVALPTHAGATPATGEEATPLPSTAQGAGVPASPSAVSAEVHPEDRDVVRRYFGG